MLVKAESLQRFGSFKVRGAYNKLLQLDQAARSNGVVARSSGNHGRAVAEAGSELGIPATVVLPRDAPQAKVRRVEAAGATVIRSERGAAQRALVDDLVSARGTIEIPPFDDADVIAGQGTVGVEIAHQCNSQAEHVDCVLVPCGGGGLAAGIAVALRRPSPTTKVIAVEPEQFNDTERSLAAGRRLDNAGTAQSICDALQSAPGKLTFDLNHRLLAGAVTVDDGSVVAAMQWAFEELKLVLEPSGPRWQRRFEDAWSSVAPS